MSSVSVTRNESSARRPSGSIGHDRVELCATTGSCRRPWQRVLGLAAAIGLYLAGGEDGFARHRHDGVHSGQRPPSQSTDAATVAKLETLPKGPFEIIVSIDDQRIWLYGDAGLIARSTVSTGTRKHPTPSGVFSVVQKRKWHRSNMYSAAPMPYMQRITWSGIALHAGDLPGYPASHGCIRLSRSFAVRLWYLTRIGTRVIIAHRAVAPFDIVDSHLFEPPPPSREINVSDAAGGRPAAAPADMPPPALSASGASPPAPVTPGLPAKRGPAPISMLISGKDGRLLVRRGFVPLFDAAVTIHDPQRPLGTYVFTAMAPTAGEDAVRWTVVSVPEDAERKGSRPGQAGKRHGPNVTDATALVVQDPSSQAAAVLDRIEIPKDIRERISRLLVPGSSLILSDHPMSRETGSDTDFIVLTR